MTLSQMNVTFVLRLLNKYMKRYGLKKEFRDLLISVPGVRRGISSMMNDGTHEQTIRRWAVNNHVKLVSDYFQTYLRKSANIDKDVVLVELIEEEVHPIA